jgi:hypothetical protein
MFCPKCGQETHSETSSFCSRCGYLLTGTVELFQFGGILPNKPRKNSRRTRGIKQGAFIFLLGLVLFPILGIITTFLLGMRPFLAGIALFVMAGAGLLRIAYALMFEQSFSTALPAGNEPSNPLLKIAAQQTPSALPPQQIFPADQYATPRTGQWLDTNDLEPRSVTEGTTKLLENESELSK